MSHLRPNSIRSSSSGPNSLPSFSSLKKALSATSSLHNSRKSRSVSPLKARGRSPATLPEEPSQDAEPEQQHKPTLSDHTANMNIKIPKIPQAAEIALTALKYLPSPLLVLSNLKTVILANEAMGRLLGLESADRTDGEDGPEKASDEEPPNINMLRGQGLSQLGIDMVQDGHQVWVSWDRFLDGLVDESDPKSRQERPFPDENNPSGGGNRPVTPPSVPRKSPDMLQSTRIHRKATSTKTKSRVLQDAVVNVVLSSQYIESGNVSSAKSTKSSNSDSQISAKMIVSIWTLDDQRYFTLTFTSSNYPASLSPRYTRSRTASRTTTFSPSSQSHPPSPSTPGSCPTCGYTPSSSFSSPSGQPMFVSPFPPMGPPSKIDHATSPVAMQRVLRMKNAMVNCVDIPMFAMWKDESISIPNKACYKLMYTKADPTNEDEYDTLSRFKVFDPEFENELDTQEFPIVKLCRTEQPFKGWKIGIISSKGERKIYDCSGEGIYCEKTGDFLGGVLSLKDVTKYDEMIKIQNEENEQQFQLICETMPQMLWTTAPNGFHDWFSKRWYDYTGLTEGESIGMGWQNPFHPDDMPTTQQRWTHSLATGDEYSTEYRCRRYDGEWRWMLGRALPLRDHKTGQILKWFGSCTDIHELVETRRTARETKEQLLNVIKHAKVTVWAVNNQRTLTFLEGKLMWECESMGHEVKNHIGRNVYDVFAEHNSESETIIFKNAIEKMLSGDTEEHNREHQVNSNSRWYRTRLIPLISKKEYGEMRDETCVAKVIGINFDVTEMKERDLALESRKQENARLLSAETAAKEASRLKSQFLANMSHEIRTPIAGVIGMAELLLDTKLSEEQKECAENIQRSANGLLTVINDILDLSKVESGRLDIEEVQFSLSVVVDDVCKMLSFVAERKNLDFKNDIDIELQRDLIVLGDPGRVRQILTNLLTNSIKFTSSGFVRLAVKRKEETDETISVVFTVEDTGIGIEEEVRHRLFKPFSQADSSTARRFGGTGLGLTICKNLVHLMHGEINLESELGRGTKATFWIPFSRPSFTDQASPLIGLDPIPARLRSEMSMSGGTSDRHNGTVSPPISPLPELDGLLVDQKSQRNSMHGSSASRSGEDISSEVDRKNIHVLVVEDNAINQQIAIKTVKKFGFSVSAVWNGKEALDYLLEASSPSHPKADIILMDCQMPILDGYRATHLIRHHDPYSSIADIRNLPIVAMTASAIQGDREKCKKAGMDDYLAKPVKGKALENMLLKWATEGKRRPRPHESSLHLHADSDSNCPDAESRPQSLNAESIAKGVANVNVPALNDHTVSESDLRNRSMVELGALPGKDDEGDRGLQRVEAEEKAAWLRDDKLLAASETDPHHYRNHPHSNLSVGPPPTSSLYNDSVDAHLGPALPALTEENITRLGRQQDGNSSTSNNPSGLLVPNQAAVEGENDSMQVGEPSTENSEPESTVPSLHGMKDKGKAATTGGRAQMRSWLARHGSDRSQITVRPDGLSRGRSEETENGGANAAIGGEDGGGDVIHEDPDVDAD